MSLDWVTFDEDNSD